MLNTSYKINLNINDALKNENNYFIVKKYTFNNNEYAIIKYNKENLKNIDDEELFNKVGNFRSVILRNNKVVVYSPSKSVPYNNFINKNNTTECWTEDFVDGTMINVFYDNINNSWELCTKSTVGGNIVFFNDLKNYQLFDNNNNNNNNNNITFRSMFFESCNLNNFDLNTLDKKYCYTFVMQHPFNRIVTPILTPVLYLIKMYYINDLNLDNVEISEVNIETFYNEPPFIFMNTNIKFINRYPITNFNDIENHFASENAPYSCVGCMIYNKDGNRTKIRNINYENVRRLRGNQPKLQYNYLCLKQENKVKDFLQFYPEHNIIFNKFRIIVYKYTNDLYMNYINCFIKKEKPLKEYEFQYKTHMFKLHEKYKTELKPNQKSVDKKCVIDYVNSLHPSQQMFVINYTFKKKVNNEDHNTNEDHKEDEYDNCDLECN